MLLPIFGFFFLGLPLLGAILAGILKNNFHANWVSAVVFIPSLLLQIPFCMVILCNDKQIFLNRFLDWLTFRHCVKNGLSSLFCCGYGEEMC